MYCTAEDVILITGTTTASDIIAAQIEVADREIDTRIRAAGLVPPTDTTPDLLRDASANLTAALIINRGRIELAPPLSHSAETSRSPHLRIQKLPDMKPEPTSTLPRGYQPNGKVREYRQSCSLLWRENRWYSRQFF